MHERFKREAEQRKLLSADLADSYAAGLPQRVTDRIFALAWDHGHAYGMAEVQSHYEDLADLAIAAYAAAATEGA